MTNNLEQPETKEALVPTLNQMGYMLAEPDEYNQLAIDSASPAQGPFLDIGAAYGLATIPALEKGAQVIAVDMDAQHLQILEKKVPESARNRLTLMQAHMPDGLEFAANSLGAVLASRVFHFLQGDDVEKSVHKIFKWLRPGGKFFFTAVTPYNGSFRKFLPVFEGRKRNKRPWPGAIEDVSAYTSSPDPGQAPNFMNLFDLDMATLLLKEAGFLIEKGSYIAAPDDFPEYIKNDGRETVGVIGIKPL
jgi:SAM-dependent methyltransferase